MNSVIQISLCIYIFFYLFIICIEMAFLLDFIKYVLLNILNIN